MPVREFTIEELENEIWRPVVGAEGFYSVSDLGRVRREISFMCKKPRLLKLSLNCQGYISVSIHFNHIYKFSKVHRLVAIAFLPNPESKPCVNHKDGIKTNNRVSNLEFVTYKENTQHAVKEGLMKPATGDDHWSRRNPEKCIRGFDHFSWTHPEKRPWGDRNGTRTRPDRVARGDKSGNVKIKEADIPLVFKLKEEGLLNREIGERLGVTGGHIGAILSGKCRASS